MYGQPRRRISPSTVLRRPSLFSALKYHNTAFRSRSCSPEKMTDRPQFQNVAPPQVVSIYRPPSPTIVPFPVPGQPIFHPIPFGCPPVAWSPIHHRPPPPPPSPTTPQQQPADDDGDGFHCPVVNGVPIRQQPQLPPLPVYFSGSVGPANESQPALQHWLPLKQQHSRRVSGKVAYIYIYIYGKITV